MENNNFAAWMISGGLKADERNREHLRALKDSRSVSRSFVNRLTGAIAAVRPAASTADPDCCPA
jgi:hypothetical protein